MNKVRNTRKNTVMKIFPVLILVLFFILFLTISLTSIKRLYKSQASANQQLLKEPGNIQVTGYTSEGFTIVWETKTPVIGEVKVYDAQELVASQKENYKSLRHKTVLTDLQPAKRYRFEIINDKITYSPKTNIAYTLPFLPPGTWLPNYSQDYKNWLNKKNEGLIIEEINYREGVNTKHYQALGLESDDKDRLVNLIIIEKSLATKELIGTGDSPGALDLWIKDRYNKLGIDTVVEIYESGSAEQVRELIRQKNNIYQGLYFVWLIGKIPPSGWINNYWPSYFASYYPSDTFYMDLEGGCEIYGTGEFSAVCYKRKLLSNNTYTINTVVARLPEPPSYYGSTPSRIISDFINKVLTLEKSLDKSALSFNIENKMKGLVEDNYLRYKTFYLVDLLDNVYSGIDILRKAISPPERWTVAYINAHGDGIGWRLKKNKIIWANLGAYEVIHKIKPEIGIIINANCWNGGFITDSFAIKQIYQLPLTMLALGSTSVGINNIETDYNLIKDIANMNTPVVNALKKYYSPNSNHDCLDSLSQSAGGRYWDNWQHLDCNVHHVVFGDPTIGPLRSINQPEINRRD